MTSSAKKTKKDNKTLRPADITARLHSLLDCRYAPPAWGLLHEVGDCTGWGKSRSADAIAMSLWPSRGLHLHGLEVKATRADWLKELKSPEKSAPIQKYCDFWWIVTEKGVVEEGELPPTWGLILRQGSKLVQKVAAPELKPEAMDRDFMAALFRRLAETQQFWIPRSDIADELHRRYEDGVESAERLAQLDVQRAERERDSIKKAVATFEEKSGVKIDQWRSGKVGAAVKTVLETDMDQYMRDLRRVADTAANISNHVTGALDRAMEHLEQMQAAAIGKGSA